MKLTRIEPWGLAAIRVRPLGDEPFGEAGEKPPVNYPPSRRGGWREAPRFGQAPPPFLPGGAILYVISDEIIPASHRKEFAQAATTGLVIGFVMLRGLDTSLG